MSVATEAAVLAKPVLPLPVPRSLQVTGLTPGSAWVENQPVPGAARQQPGERLHPPRSGFSSSPSRAVFQPSP